MISLNSDLNFEKNSYEYVMIDESGDLGFNFNSSNYFVIAALFLDNPKPIENCIKRAKKKLKYPYKVKEMKFTDSKTDTIESVLTCINNQEVFIGYLCLDKKLGHNYVPTDKNEFQKSMVIKLLSSLFNDTSITVKNLIIDEFLPDCMVSPFKNEIYSNFPDILSVDHAKSKYNLRVQSADYLAGTVRRFYTDKNPRHYKLIKEKIGYVIQDKLLNYVKEGEPFPNRPIPTP